MNRRDLIRIFGLGPLASLVGIRPTEATPIPMPNMEPGVAYCEKCDADRFLPWSGPEHVATRFVSGRVRADVFLNEERVLNAYEVIDGQWAITGLSEHLQRCERCYRAVAVQFIPGPFEVRWTEPDAKSHYVQKASNPRPSEPIDIQLEWPQN